MSTLLRAMAEHGQSPWIAFLYREFVRGGDLRAVAPVASFFTGPAALSSRRPEPHRSSACGHRGRPGHIGGVRPPRTRGRHSQLFDGVAAKRDELVTA